MCDPTGGVATAIILTTVAGVYQAREQKRQAEYNAKVAQQNARIRDEAARDAVRRGKEEAAKRLIQSGYEIGKFNAKAAAGGTVLGFGSNLDTIAGMAAIAAEESEIIKSNAAREAYGHRVEAHNFRADAKNTKAAGRAAAIGTLLNTAASASSVYSAGGGFGGGGGNLSGTTLQQNRAMASFDPNALPAPGNQPTRSFLG